MKTNFFLLLDRLESTHPEPRGPRLRAVTYSGVQARVLPVGELVLWYGMFAPCGRLLRTTGFARGAP